MKRRKIKIYIFTLLFFLLSLMFISPLKRHDLSAVPDVSEMTEGDPKRESPDKTPLPTQIPVETPMPAINSEPEMTPDRKEKKIPEVNAYNDGVSLGTVRYVSQLNEPENNGWGKYAWKAGMECTTACISMSLSYIGIDASPEEILDYSSQTVLASTYGIDEITASDLTSIKLPAKDAFVKLMEMVERYESAEENSMSPPLLYFSGNGHYHAFIVIGKGEDDQYLTTDPALSGIHIVSISEQGEITTEEEGYLERYTNNGASPAVINSIAQWQIKE